MKVLLGISIVSFVIMLGALGMMLLSSHAIKTGCAKKIADGTLTESERAICRRHGHL